MKKIENHQARLFHKSKGEYKYHDMYADENNIAYAAVGGGKAGLSYIKLYKSKATSNPRILCDRITNTAGGYILVKPDQLGRYSLQQFEKVS